MAQSSERFILEGSGIPEIDARRVPVAYHHFANASDQLIALFGRLFLCLATALDGRVLADHGCGG